MGSNLIRYLCASTALFSVLSLGWEPKTAAQTEERDIQIIQVTARKYEFSPSCIHVRAGAKVQLKITAIDRDHGFKTATVVDGIDSSVDPGLQFTSPQGNGSWKLRKDTETTIEFFAKTPGTYEFRCAVACELHHGRMKGQLVVDL